MPRDSYEPRTWTPSELETIKRQTHVHALAEEGQTFTSDWRQFTVRSTADCPHTSGTMIEVENEHGVWGVIICNDCGRLQSGPECPHVLCTWHEEGKVLICDNCGVDGT